MKEVQFTWERGGILRQRSPPESCWHFCWKVYRVYVRFAFHAQPRRNALLSIAVDDFLAPNRGAIMYGLFCKRPMSQRARRKPPTTRSTTTTTTTTTMTTTMTTTATTMTTTMYTTFRESISERFYLLCSLVPFDTGLTSFCPQRTLPAIEITGREETEQRTRVYSCFIRKLNENMVHLMQGTHRRT